MTFRSRNISLESFPNIRHSPQYIFNRYLYNYLLGNCLAVQWLGLRASTARGPGSVSGLGTKIPQATYHGQNQTNKKQNKTTTTKKLPSRLISFFLFLQGDLLLTCNNGSGELPHSDSVHPDYLPRPPGALTIPLCGSLVGLHTNSNGKHYHHLPNMD